MKKNTKKTKKPALIKKAATPSKPLKKAGKAPVPTKNRADQKTSDPAPFDREKLPFFIPDELEHLDWDQELADAWSGLKESNRAFFIEWVSNGFDGAKAWRKTLGKHKPDATNQMASVRAAQTLANLSMIKLREAVQRFLAIPREKLITVCMDALDATVHTAEGKDTEQPDHQTRLRGVAAVSRFIVNLPTVVKVDHKGQVQHDHTHKVSRDWAAVEDLFPGAAKKDGKA